MIGLHYFLACYYGVPYLPTRYFLYKDEDSYFIDLMTCERFVESNEVILNLLWNTDYTILGVDKFDCLYNINLFDYISHIPFLCGSKIVNNGVYLLRFRFPSLGGEVEGGVILRFKPKGGTYELDCNDYICPFTFSSNSLSLVSIYILEGEFHCFFANLDKDFHLIIFSNGLMGLYDGDECVCRDIPLLSKREVFFSI